MKEKAVILVGKTASGKSTTAKILEKMGYQRIVTDTTRPRRENEVADVDYHYRTHDEFKRLQAAGYYAESVTVPTSYGEQSYGSSKESYETGDKTVIVLNPNGLKAIKESIKPGCSLSIYLEVDEDVLMKRLHLRGDADAEIKHRLEHDAEDFKDIKEVCDYTLHVGESETPEEIANRVIEITESEGVNIAVCLDDNNGMIFNKRRQSQDTAVRADMVKTVKDNGGTLLLTAYSARQFDPDEHFEITEEPWKQAHAKDIVFIEQTDPAEIDCKIHTLTIYHWNRVYPSSLKCTLDLSDYTLLSQTAFPGKSHEKITKEVYRNNKTK